MPELYPVTTWAPAASRDDAIGVLFRAHAQGLVRLACVLLEDREAAEDAVQEAYVSLYRHWNGLRDHGASHAYLRAAVLNRCRSGQGQLIRARRVRGRLASVDWLEPSSETRAVEHDDARRLAAAVRSLPTRQREVVVCRYYLELTEAETAALLDIGLGSVKRHAYRGLARLQNLLGGAR
ncbi:MULTISPECIES: RNA polymerase sigma factor [unclassified Knoellia]|uniref:RNA polymerase sigma factor n=1 Tax=Knoellia altitudinis TaxID=3404795 RepID=UPI00360C891C